MIPVYNKKNKLVGYSIDTESGVKIKISLTPRFPGMWVMTCDDLNIKEQVICSSSAERSHLAVYVQHMMSLLIDRATKIIHELNTYTPL